MARETYDVQMAESGDSRRPPMGLAASAAIVVAFAMIGAHPVALARQQASPPSIPERIDYLTFARGAVPVGIGGTSVALSVTFEAAMRSIDGNPVPFGLSQKPGHAESDVEFVYQLPAPTVFDRFAVPNVLETPSPSVTFSELVEVHGSATGPDGNFVRLASATLSTHKTRGELTELTIHSKARVRWVKLRLAGGIQIMTPQTFFEFSEIVGNGTQEMPPLATHFQGVWKGPGVLIELRQDGPVVSGCYDRGGQVTGTVTGNILRATGFAQVNRIPSAFVLSVAPDGTLRGVRSTNRGPFSLYTGAPAPDVNGPACPRPPVAALGCGAVIHGITFDVDSSAIRPDSEPVLARLSQGLGADSLASIVIEGHTSSEGIEDYNLRLSERRAGAVLDNLVKRGIEMKRLQAVGIGEARPMATNDDESGRSLNRRVEVHCR